MMQTSLKEALSVENSFSRWPKRGSENRLEPECWPNLRPKFELVAGSSVFTIGSCFARNVEERLSQLGFNIPALTFLQENDQRFAAIGPKIFNKYTPPSIWQELEWTKKILERDDTVRESDIAAFLLQIGNGRYLDLQRRFLPKGGLLIEEVLEHRQLFYGLFKQAFSCPVIVITLGLLEAWYDSISRQYVEFHLAMANYKDESRFTFRQLNFSECYGFVKSTIDLINQNSRKLILITTSPIPLGRTFTKDDVIIANTYSKSVLRAVAGQLAQEHDNVDYFPSYESVMLTKQNSVWEDDLIHVERPFIGRIVSRVVEAYVKSEQRDVPETGEKKDLELSIISFVKHKQFDEASERLDHLGIADTTNVSIELRLAIAELLIHKDRNSESQTILNSLLNTPVRGINIEWNRHGAELLFHLYRLLRQIGDSSGSNQAKSRLIEFLKRRPLAITTLLRRNVAVDDYLSRTMLMETAIEYFSTDQDVMNYVAHHGLNLVRTLIKEKQLPQASTALNLAEKAGLDEVSASRLRGLIESRSMKFARHKLR